jgi:hypothetical protein
VFVGLLRTVLRRSRADWPVVLASWLLLTVALALLAAGTLYSDAVTLSGLRRELRSAPAADRAVVVRTKILPDRLATADAAIMPELAAVIAPTGGELARILGSSPYADAAADPETVTDLVVFTSFEGIERHAVLAEGSWATPGRTPVEATLSEGAAAVLGVGTGDTVKLVSRLEPGHTIEVVVVGTWRPNPGDPYWLGEPLALGGSDTSGTFTTRGPLVVDAGDLTDGRLTASIEAQWRAIPDVEGFRPESLDGIATSVTGLSARINARLPPSNQAMVATKLPAILASVDRSVLVAQAGILLLLVQFGVLAGYAVVMVAALLLDRRRTETALLRARGGGLDHLVAMAFGEALLISVPAVIAAPWIAALLVAAMGLNPALASVDLAPPLPGPATYGVAAIGGLAAILALALPTILGSISIAGVRAVVGRQVGRTLPQRVGLDLVLVLLAAIALFQLRLYGAPLTRNARGALGVDPLLVAAPAIGLLGGAVLAIRIIPRLAELAERPLARTRGLVASLAGRQLARRPLRYTRAALLLILAAALGTFAAAHAATWTRSQVDQATFASGADVRMTPGANSAIPDWALGATLRALPGVTAATPVVRTTVDLGAPLRDGIILGVDGGAMAGIVRLRDDTSGAATIAALGDLARLRPAAPGILLPEGTRRVSLVVSSSFTPVDSFAPVPKGYPGLLGGMVVLDGDGRLAHISSDTAPLGVDGARLQFVLAAPGTKAALTGPVRVLAIEVELAISDLDNAVAQGAVDVGGMAVSPDDAGDTWAALDLAGAPTAWTLDRGGGAEPDPHPVPGQPDRLTVDGLFWWDPRMFWKRLLTAEPDRVLPVLANPGFLERTAAKVGERIPATISGLRFTLDIVGKVDAFPPLGPAKPFVLVDGRSLEVARLVAGASLLETHEWWLATDPARAGGIGASLLAAPISADSVVDRADVLADLTGDPLGLGVIGILGLGSIASLLFAAIGFLVSATVSTAERLGEFALLKALGLSPRQLVLWLSAESVALLTVGLLAGTGLGLVLAWLALPFATMTASGEPPIPSPVVVVPAEALLPIVGLAVVLVLATLVIVRRQLPAARTSAVLRARDE